MSGTVLSTRNAGRLINESDGWLQPTWRVWAVCCLALTSGCASMSHTQTGAVAGSGIGALAGAMIGSAHGHTEGGALAGAAIGGLAGALAGQQEDFYEAQEAAITQAEFQQRYQDALTNTDVVMMAQNAVGEDVIINSIRTRGGMFDLSPEGIIAMKQQGVSDRVLQQMQNSTRKPVIVSSPAPRTRSSTTVFVAPAFVPPVHHYHHDYHCSPRRGTHFHFSSGRHCW